MNVPGDVEDNAITVFIRFKGKIYAKGFSFDPTNRADIEKKVRAASSSLNSTVRHAIFNDPAPDYKPNPDKKYPQ